MTTQAAVLGVANAGFAWAKVNLTLHVTGQRSDGYHLLDSLVVRAGVGDRLAVSPSDQLELFIDGPYGGAAPHDDRNLVVRAARLLDAGAGRGARLHLTKNLPAAAGAALALGALGAAGARGCGATGGRCAGLPA